MAVSTFTTDLNIIAALDDEPNDAAGLTASQAKAKFDEAGLTLQSYLNDTMIPELDAVHLPYDYTVSGGQTLKEAVEELTAGVMPDGSVTPAKLSGDIYTNDDICTTATKALYGLGSEAVPDDVLIKLAGARQWNLLQSYTTAGTFTWTVPDIHGDGLPCEIGVWMVGGGGSGAAYAVSTTYGYYLSGGASGYARNMTLTVTPGDEITVVIGAGGAMAVVSSAGTYVAGNAGGSTSFNGVTVLGGNGGTGYSSQNGGANGGQGSDPAAVISSGSQAPAMGQPTRPYFDGSTLYQGGICQFSGVFNLFNFKRYLAAGGAVHGSFVQTGATVDDGGTGGASKYVSGGTSVANAATGCGNGGGASFSNNASGSVNVKSGAGSSGAVLIYARGYEA